jgi:SNF2 family DNA or RNA helicase
MESSLAEEVINEKMEKFNILLGRAKFEAKEYQREGLEWCLRKELSKNKLSKGGIVADEMGLGKTLTLIGLMFVNFKRRTLIVVPPVLLDQWAKEIFKCSGHKALKYHGSSKKTITEKELLDAPIVLTTYNMLLPVKDTKDKKNKEKKDLKDLKEKENMLTNIKWDRIIFDEAHHLRNKRTERFSSCEKIQGKIKWLISGTPIQNKRSDLYNLFKIIGIDKVNQENVKEFAEEYILRRTKAEVGINLPPVIKNLKQVKWSNTYEKNMAEELHSLLPNQTNVFKTVNINSELANLFEGKGILTAIMKARQSCIMPSLLIPDIIREIQTGELDAPQNYIRALKSNSKLDAVIQLILSRKDNGNGKIIFCHFRKEIDLIATRLRNGGLQKVVTYDGRNSRTGINLSDAADAIVLQIQTGCEGLNLQANFSEIYFVSPHWNPCVEDQAVARCHRIGQIKPTYVFKFEMTGFKDQKNQIKNDDEEQKEEKPEQSLESYVNSVQNFKRGLIGEIIKQ